MPTFTSYRESARRDADASYERARSATVAHFRAAGAGPASILAGGGGSGGSAALDAMGRQARANADEQLTHNRDQVFTSVHPIAKRIAGQPIRLAKIAPKIRGKQQRSIEARQVRLPEFIRDRSLSLKANEDLTIVDQHAILDRIHRPFNGAQGFTAWHLKYLLAYSMPMAGISYLWCPLVRGQRQIYCLPSGWVRRVSENGEMFSGWSLRLPWDPVESPTLPVEDIIPFFTPDPSNPFSPLGNLQAGIKTVQVQEYVTEALKRGMQQGIHPGAIIKMASQVIKGGKKIRPRAQKWQMDQLADGISARYASVWNFGRPMVIDGAIDSIDPWGPLPKQMDFGTNADTAKKAVEQLFGTSPYMAGAASLGSRAESAEARRQFDDITVNPIIENISQGLTIFALPLYDSSGKYLLFIEPATPQDPELDGKNWETALKNGGCLIDEYRTNVLRQPPLPNGRGQAIMIPTGSTLQPIDGETPEDPDTTAGRIAEGDEAEGDVGVADEEGVAGAEDEPALGADAQGGDGSQGGDSGGTATGFAPAKSQRLKVFDDAFYKAYTETWLKTHGAHESTLAVDIAAFFAEQGRAVATAMDDRYGHLSDVSGDDLAKKLTAAAMAAEVYVPADWDDKLKASAKDGLRFSMFAGAAHEMASFAPAGKGGKGAGGRLQKVAADDADSLDLGYQISVDLPAAVKAGIEEHLTASLEKDYWADINVTTLDRLQTAIQGGLDDGKTLREIAAAIKDNVFEGEIGRERAETIARTETTGALNAGAQIERLDLAAQGVVTGKTWFDTADARTRGTHLEAGGQTVGVDEDFTVGGEACSYPGDPRLSAKERVKCRCNAASTTEFDARSGKPIIKLLSAACEIHGSHAA